MNLKSKKGSALLTSMLVIIVIAITIGTLFSATQHEYRTSFRNQYGSVAFALAESGIDQGAAAIMNSSGASGLAHWTTEGSFKKKTFSVSDTVSLVGAPTASYDVIIKHVGENYTVWAKSNISGSGASAERALKVEFKKESVQSTGNPGMVSRDELDLSQWSDEEYVEASRDRSTFDAYDSEGNKAPSDSNKSNDCVVGSLDGGKLSLANGQFYCDVVTGGLASDPNTQVYSAIDKDATTSDKTVYLAELFDEEANDGSGALVSYDPTDDLVEYGYESDYDWKSLITPADLTGTATEVVPVMPSEGQATQWQQNGKISDLGNYSSDVYYSGGTLTVGDSDGDFYYIAAKDLDNVNNIEVSGTVVLVVAGGTKSASPTVNFKTENASLTIYTDGAMQGVIKSTQQMSEDSSAVQNWEADRLTINVVPSSIYNNLTLTSANVHTATVNGLTDDATAGEVRMNNGSESTFVGSINAPYSSISISTSVISKYCGALLGDDVTFMGSNALEFHYDSQLGGGGNNSVETLAMTSWRQILPGEFDTVNAAVGNLKNDQ